MKQELKCLCECGKEVKGFSEKHLQKNLEIHKSISKEHNFRIELIKNSKEGNKINLSNVSPNIIVEILANNPYIINDIKEIGRLSI